MAEEEVRRARLEEALSRCLFDPVLSRGASSIDRRTWIRVHADRLERLGARALLPGDDEFPRLLIGISDEPTHLFVTGRLPAAGGFTAALVGTRLPSPSGRRFAEEAARLLARAGVTVVSGLARGIDAEAHAAALDGAAGDTVPTVAVLACGLDLCYPPEHSRLMERIGAAGALVTEFPPGAAPLRHHFIRRNRLLSGMARLVIVVEARAKSGALVTAQYGADQGRDVAAVPGDIWSPASFGTNRLILDGATPVISLDDLIPLCESLGLPKRRRFTATPLPLDLESAGDDVSLVMARLGPRPRSPDALATELDWPASRVWSALLELELRKWVRRHPAGYVRIRQGT